MNNIISVLFQSGIDDQQSFEIIILFYYQMKTAFLSNLGLKLICIQQSHLSLQTKFWLDFNFSFKYENEQGVVKAEADPKIDIFRTI